MRECANCYQCAYKKEVPGNCHIECVRNFKGIKTPTLDGYGVRMGWCYFPMLFDPTWVGPCEGFSEKLNDRDIRGPNAIDPYLMLMAILK